MLKTVDEPTRQQFIFNLDLWSDDINTRGKFGNFLLSICAGLGGNIKVPMKDNFLKDFDSQYGTRHILDSLKLQGRPEFETLLMCGGLSKNPLFIQTHAEICDLPVLCPNEKEMVLVGAAILGACAAKFYPDLEVC